MEEILNKIIEIDNKAKEIVKDEKEKKINIDEVIEKEFSTSKVVLDLEFKDEITKKKEETNAKLEQRKREIDYNLQIELDKLKKEYNEKEEQIVNNIVNSIKNEEK